MSCIPTVFAPSESQHITQEQLQELLPLTAHATIADGEIACILYTKLREQEKVQNGFPMEFILGEILFLGKILGHREARAKRRKRA